MAKLTRVTGKVFAGSAQAVTGGIGQFGSALTGTPNPTTDVATIQALPAYSNGWGSAVISSRNFPPIEEVNGALKTISYQGCYLLQEGIPEYDVGTEYSNTSIVKNISGNELILYVSQKDNNIGNALSDTTSWQRAVFTGSSPIGAPQFTLNFNATLPENCIWLEGAEVSRTTYATLFGIYGTTYGAGDGSTTFKLPDCRNRVLWGGETAGYISAGLPNITGSFLPGADYSNTYPKGSTSWANGAFSLTTSSFNANVLENTGGQGGSKVTSININAANSSSIYGNSTTVQPPAIKCRVYTRYQ